MIYDLDYMKPLFEFLENCKGVKQNPKYHPEGDVFKHSIQVLKISFKETNDTDLILAAMLHDIGKYKMNYNHEQISIELLKDFCSVKTLWLIENHIKIWNYLNGFMIWREKYNELIKHCWLPELIQLSRWNKMGRIRNKIIVYSKEEIIENLNLKVLKHFRKN